MSLPDPPPRARRGLGWREAPYVALDFETTGLDHERDVIVSYGAVPVDQGRIRLAGAEHRLVRPRIEPSPRSQMIHLLRPVDLEQAPTIEEVRPHLARALAGRYLLVWFADVEINFLRKIFGGTVRAWRRRTVDVRNLAIAVEGQPASVRAKQGYGLSSAAGRYGVPVASPHEALDDALVTAQLFMILVGKLPEPELRQVLTAASPT